MKEKKQGRVDCFLQSLLGLIHGRGVKLSLLCAQVLVEVKGVRERRWIVEGQGVIENGEIISPLFLPQMAEVSCSLGEKRDDMLVNKRAVRDQHHRCGPALGCPRTKKRKTVRGVTTSGRFLDRWLPCSGWLLLYGGFLGDRGIRST